MHIGLSSITKRHRCNKILNFINVTDYDIIGKGRAGCPYVLVFGKQTAPRTSTETSDPGEAKGRNHPLIKKKTHTTI